jgi:hypothetical protein
MARKAVGIEATAGLAARRAHGEAAMMPQRVGADVAAS